MSLSRTFAPADFTLLFMAVIAFASSMMAGNTTALTLSIGFLSIANFYYCRNYMVEKMIFIVFNSTFSFFLLAQVVMRIFFPNDPYFYYKMIFDESVQRTTLLLMFVSLLTIRIVFQLLFRPIEARARDAQKRNRVGIDQRGLNYARSVGSNALIAMYVAMVPYMLVMAERIGFVWSSGYDAFYVDFQSRIPVIVLRIAALYAPLTYIFLSTLPDKKRALIPITIFALLGLVSLGTGQRNGAMLNIVLIVLYIAYRETTTKKRGEWFSRKLMLGLGLMVPPVFILLSAFTYVRSGQVIAFGGFLGGIKDLMLSQGDSVNLISYAQLFKPALPEHKLYSFGPAIAFFSENILAQMLFGTEVYRKASVELAANGPAFSYAIAYLINPSYYAGGGGFGSNYIAELWFDFGISGVVLGSSLFGAFMAYFLRICRRGVWYSTFAFLMAQEIVYAPRAEFLGFFSPFASVGTIAVVLALHLAAELATRSNGQRRSATSV